MFDFWPNDAYVQAEIDGTTVFRTLGYCDATIKFESAPASSYGSASVVNSASAYTDDGSVKVSLDSASASADDNTTTSADSSLAEDNEDGASNVDDDDFGFLKSVAASTAFCETALMPQAGEPHVPVATATDFDDDIVYLIDSGADLDVLNLRKGVRSAKSLVRSLRKDVPANTGGGKVSIKSGIRAQIADWDIESDIFLLKDSPSLLSSGYRCRNGKFSFHHVEGRRFACFVNSAENLIIIFPLKGNVPADGGRRKEQTLSLVGCTTSKKISSEN
jgi:hypothetical protein